MLYYWMSLIHRRMVKSIRTDIPSIAVGNFAMGGTGKTPLTIFLTRKLKDLNPVVLSRGHGRKDRKVQMVRRRDMDYHLVGDEPLLIHWKTGVPVFVHRDRLLTYRIAKHLLEPGVVILDDALQYWRIDAHVRIALLREEELDGWRVFPFGLYREPIEEVRRVDVVVVKGRYGHGEFMGRPAFSMRYIPSGIFDHRGRKVEKPEKVVAFSGIARNRDFIETLREMGIQVVEFHPFPDHHPYRAEELKPLLDRGLPVITTLKDFVKLRSTGLKLNNFYYLDVEVEISREEEFLSIIRRMIDAE